MHGMVVFLARLLRYIVTMVLPNSFSVIFMINSVFYLLSIVRIFSEYSLIHMSARQTVIRIQAVEFFGDGCSTEVLLQQIRGGFSLASNLLRLKMNISGTLQ